jgi:hypothetical protein
MATTLESRDGPVFGVTGHGAFTTLHGFGWSSAAA